MSEDSVKERSEPTTCLKCGRPTWSESGYCYKCRTAAERPPPKLTPPPIVMEPRPEVKLDADWRLAEAIPCRSCGYLLQGLDPAGMCPECSSPIERSVYGDLLRFSDPVWVDRLAKGVLWIIIGMLSRVVMRMFATVLIIFLLGVAGGGQPPWALMSVLGMGPSLIATGLFVLGVWWLTSPEPGQIESESTFCARRIARWCAMAQILAVTLEWAGGNTGWQTPLMPLTPTLALLAAAGILMHIAVLIGEFAGFSYLGKLASRITDHELASHTLIVKWGYVTGSAVGLVTSAVAAAVTTMVAPPPPGAAPGAGPVFSPALPVVMIGGCAASLLILVFGIWAMILLFRYRSAFRRAAKSAEAFCNHAALTTMSSD